MVVEQLFFRYIWPKDFPLTLPGRLLPNFIVPLSWHAQIVTRNSVNLLTSNCAAGLPFFSSKLLLYLLEQDVLDENGYDFLLKMFNKRDQDCISSRQQKYIDGLIGFKVKPYLAQNSPRRSGNNRNCNSCPFHPYFCSKINIIHHDKQFIRPKQYLFGIIPISHQIIKRSPS